MNQSKPNQTKPPAIDKIILLVFPYKDGFGIK